MTLEHANDLQMFPQTDADLDHHSIKVLLIDSNNEDRQRIAQRLRSIPGYSVFEASSGAAGLMLCHLERFDCVVTELDLCDISGFEVLLSLVPFPEHPQVPVIVLSQVVEPLHRKFSLDNGAQSCLFKPRTSSYAVASAIREAIASVAEAAV